MQLAMVPEGKSHLAKRFAGFRFDQKANELLDSLGGLRLGVGIFVRIRSPDHLTTGSVLRRRPSFSRGSDDFA